MLAVSFLTRAANGLQWRWEILRLGVLLFAGYSLRLPALAWLQRRRRDALLWIADNGAVILMLMVLVLLHQLPPLIFLAFSPLLARVWIQTRRLSLSPRQLGFTELGMSLVYALGVIGLI